MTSQAYQWGETARSAQQRDDRAYARITEPARQSDVATFRNNQRPYHGTRENCQSRYVLKYPHLVLNSRTQLALNSERELALNSRAQLALRSEAHLRPCGRQRKYVGTVGIGDRGRITLVRVGSHAQQLASLRLGRIAPVGKWNQCATSSLHSRPSPVGYIYGCQVGYISRLPGRVYSPYSPPENRGIALASGWYVCTIVRLYYLCLYAHITAA